MVRKKKCPWYYETCLCFGRGKNNASYDERWESGCFYTNTTAQKEKVDQALTSRKCAKRLKPFHFLLRILHTSYPAKHHTRLNRTARASSWPGANVILAGYSSSKSALMLDANHAEISPAVHRYVCTSFWFSIPRWNHYVLNGVACAEASLHAFWIARGRPEGLLLVQANLSFCHASPHLFCRLNCWRPGAANLLILPFFLHPQRWRNSLEWYHHIERRSHHFTTGE